MPIININGGAGGAGNGPNPTRGPNGMRTGPTSQIPYMRPDYDRAFNSNKPAGQAGPDAYARAQAQKEAQERRAAAAERQKRTQEDADFRRAQQQADAARRIFERNTQAEVRAYEAGERLKAQAQAKWDRVKRQSDNRAAADAKRQQNFVRGLEVGDALHMDRARTRGLNFQRGREYGDALHIDRARTRGMNFQRAQEYGDARAIDSARNRRLREEAALGRQFENIQYRAGRTLSASSYAGVQRQASLLQGRAARYQAAYGMSPAGLGGLGGVLGGMGTLENTYATQNIMRLGGRGQRAAESREWTGLARVEQELRRIERVNVAILANGTKSTAEQKINAQRNLTAIQQARGRVGAGRSGNSGFMNMAGDVIGGAGLLLKNPYVDAAMAAASLTVGSPFLAAAGLNAAVSMSRPYYNLREATAGIGRAGNFNSRDLLGSLLPTSGGSPSWMKAQGITTSMATGILGDYGIAPRSANEAVGIIRDVRSASLSRFMGLGDQQLARSARLASTLGVTGLGEGAGGVGAVTGNFEGSISATSARSQYFATLQKVMASATAQGLDHAESLKTVEGLLRVTAGSGAATVNGGALSGFWNRMTSSGLPGMRSGEGVMSAMQGINQSFSQIGMGGAPAQNVMMMSYFGSHGGMPKTEGALQKFLGMSGQDWSAMMSNPGQKQMVQNYLNAAGKNPAIAMNYLQPFLQGRPDLMNQVFEGSAFGGANSLIKPLLKGNVTGAGYAGGVAMTVGAGLPAVSNDRLASVRDRLSKDLGISRDAAAGIVGNLHVESGLRAVNEKGGGGFGFAQWTGDRRTAFESYAKTHGGVESDQANIGFLEAELQKPQFADVLKRLRSKDITYADAAQIVMSRYENPKDKSSAALARRQMAAGITAGLPGVGDNVPTEVYGPVVNADQATVGVSRAAAHALGDVAGGDVGDAAVRFVQGADQAAVALNGFIAALINGTQAIKYHKMGAQAPGGFSAMDPTGGSYMFGPGAGGAGPARP